MSAKPLTQFGKDGRDYSVDVLRCFSCWMVILVHAVNMLVNGRYGAPDIPVGTANWCTLVVLKAMFVSATTLFVMVSGIFFLSPTRNVTPKKIWTKNIPKLAGAYIFWSIAYAIYELISKDAGITVKAVIKGAFEQPFHLWYIPMLIVLYVIAPFMRMITANADHRLYKYGITILTIALFLYTITYFPELPYFKYINIIILRTPAEELCSYACFFVLGYYLYTYRPKLKTRKIVYLLGIASILCSSIYCIVTSTHGIDTWDYHFFAKQTITTFGKNTAIFLFVLTAFREIRFSDKAKKCLVKLSNCTLIIYLVHIMLLKSTFKMGIYEIGINPVVTVIIQSIIVYLIGFVLAYIFQLVPWKKMRKSILKF